MTENDEGRRRRKWISMGEGVAVAALMISALGLWNGWRRGDDKPAVVEKQGAVPLTLRGIPKDGGRSLTVEPVEAAHALDSATVSMAGMKLDLAGDARIAAGDVERPLDRDGAIKAQRPGDGLHRLSVKIDARYVEAGQNRRSLATYSLAYRWGGSGLFGGRSLRLAGLSLISRGR